MWGNTPSRNMVSPERGLPARFDPGAGLHVRWTAKLGTESHSSPVVANGRVLIGTNNGDPKDPRHQGDRGVLMCLDEKDGRLLWQLVVPKRDEDRFYDWPNSGMSSPATVEGERVYMMSNRGEAMCLDLRGLANGNDGPYKDEAAHMAPKGVTPWELGPLDADILWIYSLVEQGGIWPHDAAHTSFLIRGPHLYLNSGNGVDNTHKAIRRPDAPSLVVLDKATGRLLACDDEHIGPRVFHNTWSAPSTGVVGGRELIFFAGGDGVVYAFEPVPLDAAVPADQDPAKAPKLKRVWKFDLDPTGPKENVHRYNSNRKESPSDVFGMPVFFKNQIYVAGGGDIWWGKNEAWLQCIDATKPGGDITTNGLVWKYPLEKHVMATPAVTDDLVYITDCGYLIHCVDRLTGKRVWTQETKGELWASPVVADGKVYVGTRRGDFWVMRAGREKEVLRTVELGAPISATVAAANGTLYVATMDRLYAFGE